MEVKKHPDPIHPNPTTSIFAYVYTDECPHCRTFATDEAPQIRNAILEQDKTMAFIPIPAKNPSSAESIINTFMGITESTDPNKFSASNIQGVPHLFFIDKNKKMHEIPRTNVSDILRKIGLKSGGAKAEAEEKAGLVGGRKRRRRRSASRRRYRKTMRGGGCPCQQKSMFGGYYAATRRRPRRHRSRHYY